MKHCFCLTTIATAVALSIFGCGTQPSASSKPAVIDNSPTNQKDTPKTVENDPPKTFTNSIGMKFLWIRPGTFTMGSPENEEGRESERETQHKVTLSKGIYMGAYTVTQEQWQAVMDKNPSHFRGKKDLPVEQFTWNDCQEFIKRLRQTDNK